VGLALFIFTVQHNLQKTHLNFGYVVLDGSGRSSSVRRRPVSMDCSFAPIVLTFSIKA
jgi:hypothetical protein